MAKRRLTGIIAASLLVLSSAMVLSSCDLNELLHQNYDNPVPGEDGKDGGGKEQEPTVKTVTITNKKALQAEWHVKDSARTIDVTITLSDGTEANASNYFTEGKAVATSSDPNVISVLGRNITPAGAGTATVTVAVGGVKDTVQITVLEKVVIPTQPIKDVFAAALANGANNGTTNTSVDPTMYSIKAVVVTKNNTSDFIVYDGETFGLFYNSYLAKNKDIEVGKTYIFTTSISNYFGCLEFSNVKKEDGTYTSAEFELVEDKDEEVAMPTPKKWTSSELHDFYESAKRTGVANATASTNPEYVEIEATNVVDGDNIYLMVDGFTETHASSGAEGNVIYLNPGKSSAEISEEMKDWIPGAKYKFTGSMMGFNSGKGYFNFQIVKAEAIIGKVTSISIDTPEKTTLDQKESIQLSYKINEEAKYNPVTWKSSDDKVLTVDSKGLVTAVGAGKANITVESQGVKSAAVEFTVTADVAECNVSIATGLVGGTIELDKPTGEKVAPGEYTITPKPSTYEYLTKTVYVTVDGGQAQNINANSDGEFKYLTEKGHTYVFGATFEKVELSTCADMYKNKKNGDFVRLQIKITALDGKSAWGADETGGAYIYNWKADYDIDALDKEGFFTIGDVVDVYGKISAYNGLYEIVPATNAFSKKIEGKTIEAKTGTLTNKEDVEALTASDVGKVYTFLAKYKSGIDNSLSSSATAASAVSIKFEIDGKEVVLRTSSYDGAYSTLYKKLDELALKEGDLVRISTPLTWYNGVQFTLLGNGSTIEKATVVTYTLEVNAATTVSVGRTIELGAKAKEWYASIPEGTNLTYAIKEGSEFATLDGNKLTGKAAGVVKVTVSDGKSTSEAFAIEVVASSIATLSVEQTEGVTLTIKDESGAALAAGEVNAGVVTIEVAYTKQNISIDALFVKVDDGEKEEVKLNENGIYSYTLLAGKSYVFSCTASEIKDITAVKAASDSESIYYKVRGEITEIVSNNTFYIQDANGNGIYIYQVNNIFGEVSVGKKAEVYGYKTSYNQTIEICNTSDKGYVRVYEDNSWKAQAADLTGAGYGQLTLANTGNLYKFTAVWSEGAYDSGKNSTLKLDLDGTTVDYYVNKNYKTQADKALQGLKIGDKIEFVAVLGNYKAALQFLFLPTSSVKLIEAGNIELTSLTCKASANTVKVDEEITLSAEGNPGADVGNVTFQITEGSDKATITDNKLKGVAEGTVKVVAKVGKVVSEPITITVEKAEEQGGEDALKVLCEADFTSSKFTTGSNTALTASQLSVAFGNSGLTCTSASKVYGNISDQGQKLNVGAIKFGTGSVAGEFSLSSASKVYKIEVELYSWNANTAAEFVIAGQTVSVPKSSDSLKEVIEIANGLDTIDFKTTSNGYRGYITALTFYTK